MRCCYDDGPVVDDESVSCSDLQDWSTEFESGAARVASLFAHPKSQAHSRQYLEGLLAPIERKNGWTIAEYVGEKEPKAMQRFLNLTVWDADDLRALNLDYVIENVGDPEGILIADPTGFAKKGRKSAGVQRQYSGTLGRIDNCQIGTFLAFVNTAGDRVLIDRELYIPEQTWFGDRARCAEAAIPADLEFATRPAQVIAMITRSVQAGLEFRWFTADEEFGQNPACATTSRTPPPPTSWRSPRTPSSPTPPVPPPRSRTGLSGCRRTRGSAVPAESGRRDTGRLIHKQRRRIGR